MIGKKSLLLVGLLLSCGGFGQLFAVSFISSLATDEEAISFCKDTPDSYVAIVWPLGIKHTDYIIETLNTHASVKYAKTIKLKKNGPFLLYRYLHQKLTLDKAEKYFKGYVSDHIKDPIQVTAIVFQTDQPLDTVVAWKREIREKIGVGYQSIHINDYHAQATEAAEVVFNNKVITKWINRLPADSKIIHKVNKLI